jgi:hypothetical protein
MIFVWSARYSNYKGNRPGKKRKVEQIDFFEPK